MNAPDFVDQAREAMRTVKTERDLNAWFEKFIEPDSYRKLDTESRKEVDLIYDRKLMQVWGVHL